MRPLAGVRDDVGVRAVGRDVLDRAAERAVLVGHADHDVRRDGVPRPPVSSSSMYSAWMPGATSTPDEPISCSELGVTAERQPRPSGPPIRGSVAPHDPARVRPDVGHLAAERAIVDVHRDRLVEPAPAREQLAVALGGRVPDHAEPRREVAGERHRGRADVVAGQRIGRAAQRGRVAQPLILVAHAGVERDACGTGATSRAGTPPS